VIEENGGRRHAAPTPSEFGKRYEEEDFYTNKKFVITNASLLLKLPLC
jgi:hypothetical protein